MYYDDYVYYIVSEMCYGGEIGSLLNSGTVFSEPDAAYVLKQVLQAVSYLHMHKIVHRDLKPNNIMFK